MKKYIFGVSGVLLLSSFIARADNQSLKQTSPATNQAPAGPSMCEDPSNLVQNCGFESGTFLPEWGTFGDMTYMSIDKAARHSGNLGGALGPIFDLGYLAQGLATAADQTYTLSFWLLLEPGTPNEFQAWWNDTLLYDNVDGAPFEYQKLTFTGLPGSPDGSLLLFGFHHGPAFWHFDDIEVVAESK